MRFGTSVVGFGLLMKQSAFKGDLMFDDVLNWGNNAMGEDQYGWRSEFIDLVENASSFE